MPRVSSRKTRQAILTSGEAADPSLLEYLVLFDSEGNPVTATLSPRGAWDAFSAYSTNSMVTYGGSSYRAKEPVAASALGLNPAPDVDTETWEIFAAQGDVGLRWRENWDGGTVYSPNDAIEYLGSTYRSRYEQSGSVPGAPPGTTYAPASVGGGTYPAAHLTQDDPSAQQVDAISGSTVSYFMFDVAETGDFTATRTSGGGDPFIGIVDGSNAYVSGGAAVRAGAVGPVHLVPGRYWVRIQQYTVGQSGPWEITINNADKLVTDPGPAWALVAKKGTDGANGATGAVGPTGPPGPIANFRGAFASGSAYARGDTVTYNGETWWATQAMVAGSAPTPGAAFAWTNLGDMPSISGTQQTYELPLDMVVVGPVGTPSSGFSVSGTQSNWFRVHAEPGSNLTITPSGATRFSVFKSDGTYANRYTAAENSNTPKTVVVDANGYVYLEVSNGGVVGPTYQILCEGTPNSSYSIPTWAKVASKGDPGAAGTGVPSGGTTGQVLKKNSATNYDTAWASAALDDTAMHFRGVWSSGATYLKGDVVIDSGGLYILEAPSVAAGATAPHSETAAVDSITQTLDSSSKTCKRIKTTGASVVQTTGVSYWFWDLAVGGTVQQSDATVPPRQYHQFYNAAGASIGSGVLGSPFSMSGLAAGRYFSKSQSADVGDPYNTAPSLTLSAGAVLDNGGPKWTKIATIT